MGEPNRDLAFGYRETIYDLVGGNRIDEALSALQDFVSNLAPQLKDSVLLLRRRHTSP